MAKKQEMISVGAWEKIRKESVTSVYAIDWHGEELVIKRIIPFSETIAIVNSVVSDCFGDTMNNYHPEAKEFSIQRYLVLFYTNLRLPTDIEKQYDLIFGTDIPQVMETYISPMQLAMIRDAIDERIDALLNSNAEMIKRQLGNLDDVLNQFGGIFDGVSKDDIAMITKAAADGIDEGKIMEAFLAQKGAGAENGNA